MTRALFPVLLVCAVTSGPVAQQPTSRAFGLADGLPSETASCVLMDSRRFLWVGTRAGVSRFDGARFVNYGVDEGLPGPIINDLLEDRLGRIWAASNGGGVARLERDAMRGTSPGQALFRVFPVGSTPTTNRVNALLQDPAGRLWAATDGGLFVSDTSDNPQFDHVPLERPGASDGRIPAVWRLALGRDGTLWLGTFRGLLARLPDGTVVSYSPVRSRAAFGAGPLRGRGWVDLDWIRRWPLRSAARGGRRIAAAASAVHRGPVPSGRAPAVSDAATHTGSLWHSAERCLDERQRPRAAEDARRRCGDWHRVGADCRVHRRHAPGHRTQYRTARS